MQDISKGLFLRRRKKKRSRERNIDIKNKMAKNKYLSIITLNVDKLNAPIKRHRVDEWIRIYDPYICCLQETHFRTKDTYRLNVRG